MKELTILYKENCPLGDTLLRVVRRMHLLDMADVEWLDVDIDRKEAQGYEYTCLPAVFLRKGKKLVCEFPGGEDEDAMEERLGSALRQALFPRGMRVLVVGPGGRIPLPQDE